MRDPDFMDIFRPRSEEELTARKAHDASIDALLKDDEVFQEMVKIMGSPPGRLDPSETTNARFDNMQNLAEVVARDHGITTVDVMMAALRARGYFRP